MKKIVILIIAVFLITGCSVKYNIVINEDQTIVEEAKLTGTDDFFANYYKTTRLNVLKSFLDIYQDILNEKGYQYKVVEEDTPYVLVNKKYSNGNEFVNDSILFNDYFDEVKYTEDGNIKKIETTGYNGNDPDNPDRFDVKELEISIACPYKVKNHNAKYFNEKTNTYFYELNDENDKILLEYDTGVKFNPNEKLIRILIICGIALVVIWITIVIINKKNNKN